MSGELPERTGSAPPTANVLSPAGEDGSNVPNGPVQIPHRSGHIPRGKAADEEPLSDTALVCECNDTVFRGVTTPRRRPPYLREDATRRCRTYSGIRSTILPNWRPLSSLSWARAASASGKTLSTWTRARPLRTRSYAPSKSDGIPIVDP